MFSQIEIKRFVGKEASHLIEQDMIVGIGSGTTVYYFIKELGLRLKQGLNCKAVPTSVQTQKLANAQGITTINLDDIDRIDITIDGADETDEKLNLIKGGGGALLQEKMVASASEQLVIISDHKKLVRHLGVFPLPVEIMPYGWKHVQKEIEKSFGIKARLRSNKGEPFVTDHNHYILDCHFNIIQDPVNLNIELHLIPGVVETGIFTGMSNLVILGYPDGKIRRLKK